MNDLNISLLLSFSRNSEAFASEFLENLEEVFPRHLQVTSVTVSWTNDYMAISTKLPVFQKVNRAR